MTQNNTGEERARTLSGELWCSVCNSAFDSEAALQQHYEEHRAQERGEETPRTAPLEAEQAYPRVEALRERLRELLNEVRAAQAGVGDRRAEAVLARAAETLAELEREFERFAAQVEGDWDEAEA